MSTPTTRHDPAPRDGRVCACNGCRAARVAAWRAAQAAPQVAPPDRDAVQARIAARIAARELGAHRADGASSTEPSHWPCDATSSEPICVAPDDSPAASCGCPRCRGNRAARGAGYWHMSVVMRDGQEAGDAAHVASSAVAGAVAHVRTAHAGRLMATACADCAESVASCDKLDAVGDLLTALGIRSVQIPTARDVRDLRASVAGAVGYDGAAVGMRAMRRRAAARKACVHGFTDGCGACRLASYRADCSALEVALDGLTGVVGDLRAAFGMAR